MYTPVCVKPSKRTLYIKIRPDASSKYISIFIIKTYLNRGASAESFNMTGIYP